ncbi:hypothetical protein AMJ39_08485 [candidate division TA06 bacterium DG_24]|jgi:hypothetical protein|uniref:Uncharacterized protein n=3 Tax=Bacteria division TA06 TaxID=1156500 RepID=A0A0S8J8T4_UNCT6|nr:MAG: hypothetical protein AMJ39_08485 [candidate division TA06 bacterium DG_24]KPK68759.1 MAG: hypothetical protein AMJ82_07405 [candidate division TA06 bacterium SM23_40]KPL05795.1 MAG: hypothetical protein AMJ71_10925 [candidate division TA06 bacterium SM1_40]
MINPPLQHPTQEVRRTEPDREMPCRDFDFDCLALDGVVPFGDYRRCYRYAPELGTCLFVVQDEPRRTSP